MDVNHLKKDSPGAILLIKRECMCIKTRNNNNPVGADPCVCPDTIKDPCVCPDTIKDPCVCPDKRKTVRTHKMGEHMGSPLRRIGYLVQ